MSTRREPTKKETEKKQREREKMGDRKGDDRSDAAGDDMLTSIKTGFDNVSKQIETNREETLKEMKDIREGIQNLGNTDTRTSHF